jgi:glycine dehydrogenase subunit 1
MTFVPLTDTERAEMLAALGLSSTDALFDVIPADLRFPAIDIGPPLAEMEVASVLEALAERNRPAGRQPFFLGAGAYRHFIPAAVGAIMGRSEFATSYTPYQPEVSQGTLQMMFEFQSMICDLTRMDISNASVYDGASAVAEAALMALRVTGRDRIVVSGAVHPHYRGALEPYLASRGVAIHTTQVRLGSLPQGRQGSPDSVLSPQSSILTEDDVVAAIDDRTACCIVSQPTFFGEIRNLAPVVEAAHRAGALVVEVYNPTSLGLLRPPGEWNVDIAVAEGQPLGIPLSFGGPYVGLMSCRTELIRQLPGRIVGETRDGQGRRGFVLTLQAREQHIRREKATSNICTSQTLISLGVTAYLALLGPNGLRSVAESCWQTSHYAATRLAAIDGVDVVTPHPFFHEFAIRTPVLAASLNRRLLEQEIIGGYDLGRAYPGLDDVMLVCCTEATTRQHIDQLAAAVQRIVRETDAHSTLSPRPSALAVGGGA